MTFAPVRVPNYVLISGVGVEAMSSKAYYSAKGENGRHHMLFLTVFLCAYLRDNIQNSQRKLCRD